MLSQQSDASSSRNTPFPSTTSPSPLAPQRMLRTDRSNRMGKSSVAFVLALCLPYVATASANPLPQNTVTHHHHQRLRAQPPTVRAMTTLHHVVSAVKDLATSLISDHTDGPAARHGMTPRTFNPTYHVVTLPPGYIQLIQRFNPGFIVLSVVIAFVGSLCTLELLVRRTTNSGWRNQALLGSAGFCFGAVSTFAMHFVFNNALSLHHPDMDQENYPALYLSYNAGFTVLSLIVSCLAMTFAFFVMGTHLRDWICIPGSKKRRSDKKRERQDGDEYGKWKRSHKKVKRRATMGVTALFAHASSVAKWSLMDSEMEGAGQQNAHQEKDDKRNDSWQDELSKIYESRAEAEGDQELQELEFRLGRSAVKLELERRTGGMPTHDASSRISSKAHSHKASSETSFAPPPAMTCSDSAQEPVLFAPTFNFPPRVIGPIPSNGGSVTPRRTESPTFGEVASLEPTKDTRRRASLPVNGLVVHRTDRPSFSGPTGLSRIQSLPEVEQDLASSSSRDSSVGTKKEEEGQAQTVSEQLSTLTTREGTVGSSARKVKLVANGTRLARIGMFLGFDVVTVSEIVKIMITGALAGFGVVGMHYIGQASITGMPYIVYQPGYVVGSVIIACGAVMIALYIMFIMLRPKLKHTWISKICVAMILSVAVCAMHFCGMMGTTYGWPTNKGISRHNPLTGTNAAITGIVSALAFLACIGCCVFFVLHSINLRRERARRRRVVVAAVLLDDRDRVLVNSTDGMLPMCDIASLSGGDMPQSTRSIAQSMSSDSTVLGMDLSTGHDAFVSALKLTWSWKHPQNVPNPITSSSLAGDKSNKDSSRAALAASLADIRRGSMVTTDTINTTTTGSKPVSVNILKFLEKFALSSSELAIRLTGQTEGVSRLGVLYDQILTTGWVRVNQGADTVSKGQLIFLVRRVVSSTERSDLETRHFIFADSQAVAGALHKTLSVPFDHTMPLLDDIRSFCDSTLHTTIQPGKLYGGVAVVQATPFDGLRVLLESDMRSQLPMREMCAFNTTSTNDDELTGTVDEIGEALALLQGMNILSVIARNMTFSSAPDRVVNKRVLALLSAMERAIVPMLDEMLTAEDMEHILPRLTLHPMLVPLTPGGSKRNINSYVPPYVIVFYANYDAAVNTFTDKWLPFSLFRAQNACVMAPKVAAATKLDHLYVTENPEEEELPARRPSKVQFDFPAPSTHIQGGSGNGGSQFSSSLPPVPPVDNGMFGGFTFPPRSDDQSHSNPKLQTQSQGINRNSSTRATSTGPRRSSLARSRFGSTGDDSALFPNGNGGHNDTYRELTAGVAHWDQDWLLNLLKTHLRADA